MDKKSELLIKKFLTMKNLLLSLATILTFCCFNIVTAQDCVNTDNGAVDAMCKFVWYNESPGSYGCTGGYDTADFIAADMCCACGEDNSMPEDPDVMMVWLFTMMDSYGDGWRKCTIS